MSLNNSDIYQMGLNTETVAVGIKKEFTKKDIESTITFLQAIEKTGSQKKAFKKVNECKT